MQTMMKAAAKAALKQTLGWVTRREYRGQTWYRRNERPIEYGFALQSLRDACPRTVLDVGTGTTAFPSLLRSCGYLVTAIDNVEDYWPKGMFNRHWHVMHNDIRRPSLTERFDAITCLSVLEHIPEHAEAVRGMFSLLKPGGSLILTCPYRHAEYIENAYALPNAGYGQSAPYVCQQYDAQAVEQWRSENDATLVTQEFWRVFEGEYWTEGALLEPPVQVEATELHQLTCLHFRRG